MKECDVTDLILQDPIVKFSYKTYPILEGVIMTYIDKRYFNSFSTIGKIH